jgi:hypothetical protein
MQLTNPNTSVSKYPNHFPIGNNAKMFSTNPEKISNSLHLQTLLLHKKVSGK